MIFSEEGGFIPCCIQYSTTFAWNAASLRWECNYSCTLNATWFLHVILLLNATWYIFKDRPKKYLRPVFFFLK